MVVISKNFLYTLGRHVFRNASERLLLIFFLNCDVTNIDPFVSLFFPKIRRLVLIFYKVNLVTYLIILDISLNFCPAFYDGIFMKQLSRDIPQRSSGLAE